MRKLLSLLLAAVCVMSLWGCGKSAAPQEEVAVSTTETTTMIATEQIMQFYEEFLAGERSIKSKSGYTHHIDGNFYGDHKGRYAYFDVNGDGIPELHVKGGLYQIFSCVNGELVFWIGFPNTAKLLNSGAILNENAEDKEYRIAYYYTVLDSYGNEQSRINLKKLYPNQNGAYDETSEYWFGSEELSMEEWDARTEKYFSIGSDKIKWIDYVPAKTSEN